jgi:Holliday junction resolvase RusA-like endonuclease
MLKLTLVYESPTWLTKAGKLRRVDVQNLEKLVIDTLFSKWDTDDSRLVEVVSRKAWGRQEQVQVVLERALVKLGRAGGVG